MKKLKIAGVRIMFLYTKCVPLQSDAHDNLTFIYYG